MAGVFTPGTPSFYVASVVTLVGYTQKWCTRMGVMDLYPELSEEIAAPLLGLMVGVLASRIIKIVIEEREKAEAKKA